MVKRIVLNKKVNNLLRNLEKLKIRKSLTREQFLKNSDVQDIILFNLQQAIQRCIDIGTHVISDEGWEIPGSFSEVFRLLAEKKVISDLTMEKMIRISGFRNLVVHQYEDIDLNIVYEIYHEKIGDIEEYLAAIQNRFPV